MISNRAYFWALFSLIVLHILMFIALLNGFPPVVGRNSGWYVPVLPEYGAEAFRLAKSLAEFHPVLAYPTLGFPLLLVPFIWIFKAAAIEEIVLPVTVFYSVLLFSISIFLIASIAGQSGSGNKRGAGLLSAAVWVILPYLAYLAVLLDPRLSCVDIAQKRTPYLMWAVLLEHPLANFLVIAGVYFFLVSIKQKGRISYAALAGGLFGFASLTNPLTTSVIGLSFVVTFLFMKYLKAFLCSAAAFGIFSIPQLIYNRHFNGSPLSLLDISLQGTVFHNGRPLPNFAVSNIFFSIGNIIRRFDAAALFLFVAFVLLILAGSMRILKKNDSSKILLIWFLPYLCFIAFFAGFTFSILEFILPVLPALIIIFSLFLAEINGFRRR